MSGASGFSGILRRLGLIEAVPGTPPSGQQAVYIDPADHHLKRKNSAGSITDLETGGGSLTLDDGTTTVAGVTELDVARIDDLTGGVVAVLPQITGQGDGTLNFASTSTKLETPDASTAVDAFDSGFLRLKSEHGSTSTPGDQVGVGLMVGSSDLFVIAAQVASGRLGLWTDGTAHIEMWDVFGFHWKHRDLNGVESVPAYGRDRTLASAPISPTEGDRYYNTADHTEYIWNGSAWLDMASSAGASFATPTIALGSSAAAGAAGTVIRSDSTIAAFDATSPTTQAIGDSAVVGTAAFAARRDHKHAVTNPLTTQDDLWVGGASGAPSRLAKGTDSQVLTVDPTTHHLVWATNPAGFSDPMTSRGDIIVRNSSNTTARLAKGSADTYLGSDGTDVSYSAVTDAKLSTSDITTNDVSTSKHGFAPKGDGSTTKFLNANGAYSTPAGGSGDLTRLSETVLGSAAADITITALSGAYRDLVIVGRFRSTDAGTGLGLRMRVGSGSIDTGSNYAYRETFAGWTGGTNSSNSGDHFDVAICPNSGAATGSFGYFSVEILNYADTAKNKGSLGKGVSLDGSGFIQTDFAGLWLNHAAALDQVRIYASAGNLDTGSSLTIYGRG
jgi:hypothetical protein